MPHEVFDVHVERYDRWFDDHRATYLGELKILMRLPEAQGADLEGGVGTSRIAAPLGIRLGLDPSLPMLLIARARGIETVRGVAEAQPFRNGSMKSVLVMTSLCYFDDPAKAFQEIHRVLSPGGRVVIGFLGRGGEIAERYRKTRERGTFLAHATFYMPGEVISMLSGAGFTGTREQNTGNASAKGFHVVTATRPGR
ncbi:MAG: class I SAM-dependent methyltransferase [Methanomicrobiales archaeon]|nr:class I SAM-dependent methyltransferase [Methanomicrobiales archaeon]